MSATARRRRWLPVFIATARAPIESSSWRDSVSGTMPSGEADSTSAAVYAADSRSLSQLTRKLAIDGT
jgi:hypothetical protein